MQPHRMSGHAVHSQADLYSKFHHVGFWSLDKFEQSFLRAQGFRSRVEFMDFVDWKLPLTCAYTIKSRIWLSHPSASSGVRGSVLSSSCTPHSACKVSTESGFAVPVQWWALDLASICHLCWRSFFSGVNEFEDKQLLEPRNRHPICFVGPF